MVHNLYAYELMRKIWKPMHWSYTDASAEGHSGSEGCPDLVVKSK